MPFCIGIKLKYLIYLKYLAFGSVCKINMSFPSILLILKFSLVLKSQIDSILIVCPAGLKNNWKREKQKKFYF